MEPLFTHQNRMFEGSKDCASKCKCHKVGPLLIVLIGVTFLLGALGYVSQETVAIVWPILLIVLGLKKMCGGMCKCCGDK